MNQPDPQDELAQLLKRMDQDALTSEDSARLNELLQLDDATLDKFIRHQTIEAQLAWRFGAQADVAHQPLGEPAAVPAWRRHGWMLAIAAMLFGLLIGVPLGLIVQGVGNRDVAAVPVRSAAIARLKSISPDARWGDPSARNLQVGAALEKGWLNLQSGVVDLEFSSGAVVQLTGPASFAIDTPLRGYLNYGRVRVHAPESARDFSVGTASMEVVDLGTEFDLSVNPESGAASVDVVEGLVDLYLASGGRGSRIQALRAGESAAIDASGEITSLRGGRTDPQLVAHWRMDDDANSSRVVDSSPHQFDGQLNMPTQLRSLPGVAGKSLNLGADGFVDFSEHHEALTSAGAFTLAAWVRNADDIVFSVSDGTELQRIQFELHPGALYYGWQQGDIGFDRVSASVPSWEADRWYHVAVSVSGGGVILYLDGRALIEPKRTGGVINTRAIAPIQLKKPTVACLGRVPSNHVQQPQFLGGQLDDVQLYGRALDEAAIRYLYEHPGQTLSSREQRPAD